MELTGTKPQSRTIKKSTVFLYAQITQWELFELRCLYLGWRVWEWFIPMNPKRTHNYLEQTYSAPDIKDQNYAFEAEVVSRSDVYERFYLYR
jgi:hypothetical protein